MRVRVSMDVGKPLKRGMFIKMGKGIQRKIFFKYKRLGNFCYTCGGLDHVLKECELIEEGNNEEGELASLPSFFFCTFTANPTRTLGFTANPTQLHVVLFTRTPLEGPNNVFIFFHGSKLATQTQQESEEVTGTSSKLATRRSLLLKSGFDQDMKRLVSFLTTVQSRLYLKMPRRNNSPTELKAHILYDIMEECGTEALEMEYQGVKCGDWILQQ
ncbi:hypothetical protein JHK87_006488 [Glycine soja]|nr:hypothetical protein JHK87_006488 [Glycine soja]